MRSCWGKWVDIVKPGLTLGVSELTFGQVGKYGVLVEDRTWSGKER